MKSKVICEWLFHISSLTSQCIPALHQTVPPKYHFLAFSKLVPFTSFPTYLDDYYVPPNSAAFSAPLESFPSHPTIILFIFTCPSSMPPASVFNSTVALTTQCSILFPTHTLYTHIHILRSSLSNGYFFHPYPTMCGT